MNDDLLKRMAAITGEKPKNKPPLLAKKQELLEKMRGGTSKQESDGDTSIINSDSGATGEFQVMPFNIPKWTRKYYGRELTQDEFRKNPEAQRIVFYGEMGSYLDGALKIAKDEREAVRMAAVRWYGGGYQDYDDPTPQFSNGKQYPSRREYTTKIADRIFGGNQVSPDKNLLARMKSITEAPISPNAASDTLDRMKAITQTPTSGETSSVINQPTMQGEPNADYLQQNIYVGTETATQNLLGYRQRVQDELQRAKTPARRDILKKRLVAIEKQIKDSAKQVAAMTDAAHFEAYGTPIEETPKAETVQPSYQKREIKPGDKYYEFEKSGKTKDGDEYLGTVGDKYRFKNADGDEYEYDAASGKQNYLAPPKRAFDSEKNEYLRSENQANLKEGEVRRVREGKNFIFRADNSITEELSPDEQSKRDDAQEKYQSFLSLTNQADSPEAQKQFQATRITPNGEFLIENPDKAGIKESEIKFRQLGFDKSGNPRELEVIATKGKDGELYLNQPQGAENGEAKPKQNKQVVNQKEPFAKPSAKSNTPQIQDEIELNGGGKLKRSANQDNLDEGTYRFESEDGETWIVDPKEKKVYEESAKEITDKIPVKLVPKNQKGMVAPQVAKKLYINQVADYLAKKYDGNLTADNPNALEIRAEDVSAWMEEKGIVPLGETEKLSDEKFYAGELEAAETTHSFNKKELKELAAYSFERKSKLEDAALAEISAKGELSKQDVELFKEYGLDVEKLKRDRFDDYQMALTKAEMVKRDYQNRLPEFQKTESDGYLADIKTKRAVGMISKAAADKEISAYNEYKEQKYADIYRQAELDSLENNQYLTPEQSKKAVEELTNSQLKNDLNQMLSLYGSASARKEKVEQEEIAKAISANRVANMSWGEYTKEMVKTVPANIVRSALEVAVSGTWRGIALTAASLDDLTNPSNTKNVEDYETWKIAQNFSKYLKEYLPVNEDLVNADGITGFFAGDVSQGAGSSIGMIPGGFAKYSKSAIAFLSSLQMGGDAYREARDLGVSENKAQLAALYQMPLGATEIFGMGKILDRLNSGKGASVWRKLFNQALIEGAKEAPEETLQEGFQTTSQNIIQKYVYNPDKKWSDGVVKAMAAAGISSSLISGGVSILNTVRNRAIYQQMIAREEARGVIIQHYGENEVTAFGQKVEVNSVTKPLIESYENSRKGIEEIQEQIEAIKKENRQKPVADQRKAVEQIRQLRTELESLQKRQAVISQTIVEKAGIQIPEGKIGETILPANNNENEIFDAQSAVSGIETEPLENNLPEESANLKPEPQRVNIKGKGEGVIVEDKGDKVVVDYNDGNSRTIVRKNQITPIEKISEKPPTPVDSVTPENREVEAEKEQIRTNNAEKPLNSSTQKPVVQGIQLAPRTAETISNATEIAEEVGAIADKQEEKEFQKEVAQAVEGKEGSEAAQAIHSVIEDFKPSEEKSERKFSSTQVDFPETEANQMREFGKKLVSDNDLHENGREERPHFTTKFGLTTADAEKVRPLVENIKPFKVKLGKTFIFENEDFDVVNVGVENSPELEALNKIISENTPNKDTHPNYVPHAALAYVKKGEGKKYVDNAEMEGVEVEFNGLTFSGKDRVETFIPFGGKDDAAKPEDRAVKTFKAVDKNGRSFTVTETINKLQNAQPDKSYNWQSDDKKEQGGASFLPPYLTEIKNQETPRSQSADFSASNEEKKEAPVTNISKSFDDAFAQVFADEIKIPEDDSLETDLQKLADILGDPLTLKSAIKPEEEFDAEKYKTVKPVLESIYNRFKNEVDSVDYAMLRLLQTMKERGFKAESVMGIRPFIIKFIEENTPSNQEKPLPNRENESKKETEVKSDVESNESDRDSYRSDENAKPEPVQRPEQERGAASVRSNESGSGDGDVSGNAERVTEPSGDLESAYAREDSTTHDGDSSSQRDSDSASNRIPERKGNDYLAPKNSLSREGSWRETAKRNLDIIELVKKLETENRLATPEEQSLLVKFTGWGASEIANNLFPGLQYGNEIRPEWAKDGWKDLAQRAKDLFTPEELKTAARSTRNAHYTSESIIRGIWDAVTQFGFSSGKILEPGMGVGLFGIAAPESLFKKSHYTGIERDSMTARIAKQILQNQAVLENDFVKQNLPDNFFDVAIGNPPFSDTKILNDPRYKKYRFMTHDYFFAKSIDKVRPGGILVFVTSKGTMDKTDPKMREYIAERADLLGAIRLPQTAFKENAGTEVVTDVLFFRKRLETESIGGEDWIGLGEVMAQNKQGEDQTGLINQYFINHPEMVLGSHSFQGSMYRANEYTVIPNEESIDEQFQKAVENLPSAIYVQMGKTEETVKQTIERDWDPKAKKEGSLYIHDDGRLMRREFGSGVELSRTAPISKTDEKWLRSYVNLRTALKQAQSDQLLATDENGIDWQKSLTELNRVYDDFAKRHGRILDFSTFERTIQKADGTEVTNVYRRFRNNKVLNLDVESPLVEALETITEDGQIVKSGMLLSRTIKPPAKPEVKELSDALAVSLDALGKLNLTHVTEIYRQIRPEISKDEVISELGEAVFEIPSGEWQLADEYLSGFVVDKLEEAELAAKSDKRFQRNVDALMKVQPAPLETVDISPVLGAAWVGAKVTSDFAREILKLGVNSVTFEPMTNTWSVDGSGGRGSRDLRDASNDWGTSDRSPNELLDAALNNRSVKITFKDSDGKVHTDVDASALANEKIKQMKESFRRWIWTDAKRAAKITEKYNRQYNNIAPRFFDGSHLSTPGLSSRYKLHPHQKRAVWRILQTGNTYLAHAVGAGKTLEMIVSGMEQKRLGLISKPMYVVPNHMLKQFSSEFLEAYPLANILVADENNFAKEKRQAFTAQAALNDLDAVIITHSAFGLIRSKPETADVVIDEMIGQMRMMIAELDETDRSQKRTIKDLENRIEKIEQKFGSLSDASGKDDVVSFEDLGVDFVYVDEAHEFRKLDFVTNRVNVKGIDPKGSQRSLDLLIKLRWLETQRPGRSAVLASGTPITNTLAELYSIMRYLDPAELDTAELAHFDAWSAQFGEAVADYEMNAAGNYEIVERFSRFVNIPELMKRARKFMDVLTLKQLGSLINLPTVKGGTPEIKVVPATEAQSDYLKGELAIRIETSRKWKPSKDEPGNPDPLINIITDGRLAAIDMRFVDPHAENDPNSKLNVMIDNIIAKYNETKDLEFRDKTTGEVDSINGAAQIVFSAVGFGEQVAAKRGFDAKAWMLKRLTTAGIPLSEIAFMGDYKTATAKERMFREMRQGAKKILVGSPKNMGTGVNVQKRLKVLHYLSPPWYPSDVEQPDGRIIRQGNQNEEVEIYRYATKGTYDSTAWAMIARKSRAIEQAMTGDDSQRSLEDISESSQYEMASAVSAGDDRAIKLAGLRRDIEKLERLRGAHSQEQRTLSYDRRRSESEIEYQEKQIEKFVSGLAALGKNLISNEEFSANIGIQSFAKRSEIGTALKSAMIAAIKANKGKAIAQKREIPVELGKVLGKFPLTGFVYATDQGVKIGLNLTVGEVVLNLSRGSLIREIEETDAVGLATRIFNALNSIAKLKTDSETAIETQKRQLKQIDSKTGQPFADEQELYDKIAEYAQLQAEMAGEGLKTNNGADFLKLLNENLASAAIEKVINNYLLKNPVFERQENEPFTLKSVLENDKNWQFDENELNLIDEKGNIDYEQLKNISDGIERGELTIARLNSEEEQGRIAGGRRNVEASIIAGASQTASGRDEKASRSLPWEQHKQAVKNQETLLEKYAKDNGIWYKFTSFDRNYLHLDTQSEAHVFHDPKTNSVIKVVGYDNIQRLSPLEYIDERIALHNYLFPDTKYELLGFTRNNQGFFNFVLRQQFITDNGEISDNELISHLETLSLRQVENKILYFTNDRYTVHDLHPGNIMKGENGIIHFIDPIVEINRDKVEMVPFGLKSNKPATLKSVYSDYLSNDDQPKIEKMRQLPFVSFDELLPSAKIERFGDKIKANPESHEIYRRAFEQARIENGQTKLGSTDTEDIFGGIFLKPDTVAKTVEILRRKASEAKELGYSAEEIEVFEYHAKMLEEATNDGNGTAIIYIFDKALPEEIFHQADYLGAIEKSLLSRHDENSAKKLDAHRITQILWQKHFSRFNEYNRLSPKMLKAVLRAEIAPFISEMTDEDLDGYGITKDERADYLLTWFEGYASRNGIESLDNFEREELNVQEFIEKIKEARQIRQDGQRNEENIADDGKSNGKTERGPPSSGQPGRLPAGTESAEIGKNEKLASLPATLRRAGIEAEDVIYEIFGDKAAQASARKMLEENGIEGSIRLLRGVKEPDVDHAILSFMLQRILLDNAAEISQTNPTDAENLRALALKLGREHSLKAVKAGRFTRAASIVQNSVEGVMFTVQGIVEDVYGEDKTLSPEEWARIEAKAREGEKALAELTALKKDKINLQRKIKRLENEKTGKKRKKREQSSMPSRKKLVELVKDKNGKRIEEIRKKLLEKFAPVSLKSIIGENAVLNPVISGALGVAKELEKSGEKPQNIYQATGWERGSEGKWRTDLPGEFKIRHKVLRSQLLGGGIEPLDFVLDAPELFAAYPSLRNVAVAFETLAPGNDAAYADGIISLSDDLKWIRALGLTFNRGGGLTTNLKHEIQHAIQEIEGFSTGTSSKKSGFDAYQKRAGEVEARNAERRMEIGYSLPISQTEDVARRDQILDEPFTLKSALEDDGGFDEETLNDFAEIGAMFLTEGMAMESDYLPEDFHAQMTGEFGDVIGADFQKIYELSWKKRDQWLSDIRTERTRENVRRQFEEELEDWEIDDILGERREKSARRRALEVLHRVAANKAVLAPSEEKISTKIDEIAPTDEIGTAAKILATGGTRKDVFASLENISEVEKEKLYRQAVEVLSFAKKMKSEKEESDNPVIQQIEQIRREVKESKKKGKAETAEAMRKLQQFNLLMERLNKSASTSKDLQIHAIIVEMSDDVETAVAASLIAYKTSLDDIYLLLGISDRKQQREILRRANEVFEQAKTEFENRQNNLLQQIADAKDELRSIGDLEWKARNKSRQSAQEIADEIKRIKSGELSYRTGQVVDVLNASRTLMASFDLSAPLRQGGFFTFAKPELQAKAYANMFKSFTEQNYGRAIEEIENHQRFVLAQRAGVDFAEAGRSDTDHEELYRGKATLEKIPFLGKVLNVGITGWSERTYTAFLDTQRMVIFDVLAGELIADGLSFERNRKEFEKIAEFINIATGRGTAPTSQLGKILMDLPFFAPRYTLSRLQLLNQTLNPVAYYKMPPHARKIIAKSAFRFYGTTAAILFLPALLGLVSFDPDDDEFLKIKVGNTKYDIFAGLLPPAKMIIKIVHSAYRTKLGQDNRVPGEFWYDIMDFDKGAIPRFIRGKLSPVVSLAVDAASGKDFVGNEFSWGKGIGSRLLPITFFDIYEAAKLDGAVGVGRSLPFAFFGVGVNNYKARLEKPRSEAEKLAAKATAMKLSSKPQTAEEKLERERIAEMTYRSRMGEDISAELRGMVSGGLIPKDKVDAILSAKDKSYLVDKAENLSLEEFEAVFRAANQKERENLLPLLNKKLKNADVEGKLTPEAKKEAEKLGGRVLGDVPMPDDVKSEFERFDIKTPDVGETISIKKGEKTRLSPEQYEKYRKESLERIYKKVQEKIKSDAFMDANEYNQEKMIRAVINKERAKELKQTKKELKKAPQFQAY